jgi:hypothetical protein
LSDVNISKALTLNVLTSGYDMLIGSQPVVIIYRIYYKLLKTNIYIYMIRSYTAS